MEPSIKNVDDRQFQFHLIEFQTLRMDINNTIDNNLRIMQTIVVSSAAVYAWAATIGLQYREPEYCSMMLMFNILWHIPLALGLLGAVFALNMQAHVNRISKYILSLENAFGTHELGWEKQMNKIRKRAILYVCAFWTLFFIFLLITTALGDSASLSGCDVNT